MLDFTSSLYLGLGHASGSLGPWTQLTTGVPAALAPPPGAAKVAEGLAQLQGCERALLGPSTLHLFWDLFGMLAGTGGIALYVNQGAYDCTVGNGPSTAARRAGRRLSAQKCASIGSMRGEGAVAGRSWSPTGAAPAAAAHCRSMRIYRSSGRTGACWCWTIRRAWVSGAIRQCAGAYGQGGGGSLRRRGCGGTDVIVVCSLAKAFGAPVAALSGSKAMVECVEARAQTRVHCSARQRRRSRRRLLHWV